MRYLALVLLTCIAFALVDARANGAPPEHDRRIVGYFTEWNADFDVDKLRPELLTHVIYAFAVIKDGEIAISNLTNAIEKAYPGDPPDAPFKGRFRQLQQLKQKHPHLRTLISVGGWGGSKGFSEAAMTDASRDRFARSCATFVNKYGFDGVDIDWEFPVTGGGDETTGRPEDSRNFTLLLEALRRALDGQGGRDGKRYLLTIAAPAGPQNYKHIELDRIHAHLDWINLMTYDMAGTWSKVTCFNAPLYTPDTGIAGVTQLSAEATVRAYRAAGVPAAKIVLGVPFYGKAFAGVANVNHGIFQPHSGKRPDAKPGDWAYRAIARRELGKTVRRHWHEQAKVPWLYDEQARVTVSYEDPESARAKAAYAREHDLGGVMVWELSQDDERASLLEALNAGLSGK